jgi:nitrogen-specific signal transduction histidine kinase
MKDNSRSLKHIQDKIETEYSCLFNNDKAVMLIIDPDSLDIIYANNAASNFYGRSFEDFRQMKITQIDMMSEQKIKVELSKAEKGIQNHFISKQKLQNNEIHDVDICLIPINNKKELFFV